MKNSWLLVGILVLIVVFRQEISAFVKPYLSNPAPQISVATPPDTQVIVVQSTPVQVADTPVPNVPTDSCARPIKNPTGCAALTTRETCAGLARGGCESILPLGSSLIVYTEAGDYYMTTLPLGPNGAGIPAWVLITDVYLSQ